MKTTKLVILISRKLLFLVVGIIIASITFTSAYELSGQPYIIPGFIHRAALVNSTQPQPTNQTVSVIQFNISQLQKQLDHYMVLQQMINDNITAIKKQIDVLQTELIKAKQQEQQALDQSVTKLVIGLLHFYNTDKCYDTHVNTTGQGYNLILSCNHIKGFNTTTIYGSYNLTVASRHG